MIWDRFELLIVDTTSWGTVATIPMAESGEAIEFADDGYAMLIGFKNGLLRLYDTSTWTETGDPIAAQDFVASISITADGSRVTLGDGLGTFAVYDMEARGALEEYRYRIQMQDVGYIHDDQRMLMVPRHQSPFVLWTDANELLSLANARLSRSCTPDEWVTYAIYPCPTLEQVRNGVVLVQPCGPHEHNGSTRRPPHLRGPGAP